MSQRRTRREFLADVGRTALYASVGLAAARDLGITSSVSGLAFADAEPPPLQFGALEPLVALMQETSIERLLPTLVERLRAGTQLRTLVAAGALANARTFGGEDYIGFHTMMAFGPAWEMACAMPPERSPLPVLKVLYRNTARIRDVGGREREVLRAARASALPDGKDAGSALRERVRAVDVDGAEGLFAAVATRSSQGALDALVTEVSDLAEVHRVVLPIRAWELLPVVGEEHAHTLLRQSLRYCLKEEGRSHGSSASIRTVLPAAMSDHGLLDPKRAVRPAREADDAWVEFTSQAIFQATPEQAAEIAAKALAAGYSTAAVGEAVALATNQLLLRDAGRSAKEARPGKPLGSVHGDSIGVHACDSAHAWRSLARAATGPNRFACAIAGAFQAALDRTNRGGDFVAWKPLPLTEDVEKVATTDAAALVGEARQAIEAKDQARAAAIVHRCGVLGHPETPVVDLLRGYATSEDGALHAEKYFRTATDEFAASRPAFRWRHLVALARVTASEYGTRAAGYEESVRLLGA